MSIKVTISKLLVGGFTSFGHSLLFKWFWHAIYQPPHWNAEGFNLCYFFSKVWFPLEIMIYNKLSTWIFDNWLSSSMFIKSRNYKGTLPLIHRYERMYLKKKGKRICLIVLTLLTFTVLPNILFQICPNSPVSQLSCIFINVINAWEHLLLH